MYLAENDEISNSISINSLLDVLNPTKINPIDTRKMEIMIGLIGQLSPIQSMFGIFIIYSDNDVNYEQEEVLHMVDFDFSKIIKSIETWDRNLMKASVKNALSAGVSPERIMSEGLSKGMDAISKQFDEGSIYLPQVLAASNVMDEAMGMIISKLNEGSNQYKGVIVMGTVAGDIHQIGKNVCCAMLRGARYKVIDLGPDVSPEDFIRAVRDNKADAVGGSALMTTTLEMQKRMVKEKNDEKCDVLMLFGGAPCTLEWVKSIKGDGYSASGREMVILVDKILEKSSESK